MATAKKAAAKKAAPAKKATVTAKVAAPAKKATAKTATKAPAKKASPQTASEQKAPSAFMKNMTPSAALAAVIGSAPLPRTEVVKKLWEYIKEHKLQDEANKRMIVANAQLKEVFGKAKVSMFEMAGLISKHLK